jgi:hypothetical protein
MRLSAVDCLRRGWANLSANWELVPLQWLEGVLLTGLAALGAFLSLLIVGASLAGVGSAAGAAALARRLAGLSPALLMALVAGLAVGAAALLLHCWFQAGTFGVLAAAERQALPGPRRSRDFFRTFSRRDFLGWGGLYVWRFLGAALLFGALALALGGAALLWLLLTALGGVRWGSPAAFGIGAGGALPVGFLSLALALWLPLAQAGLARDGASLRTASRQGLDVLGRRLGAVAALVLLVLGAALGLAAIFLALEAAADSLLAGAPGPRVLVRFLLLLLQAFPNTLLAMILAGALVALVRSETPSESRRHPEVQTA